MDQGVKTRFVKKGAPKFPSIPGTKPSLYNFQLLSSTGVPALDNLLGGGLAVGSLVLVEDLHRHDEDESGSDYSNVLLKYFLSEGAANRHSLFFGSCSENSSKFLSNLPEIVTKSQSTQMSPG